MKSRRLKKLQLQKLLNLNPNKILKTRILNLRKTRKKDSQNKDTDPKTDKKKDSKNKDTVPKTDKKKE